MADVKRMPRVGASSDLPVRIVSAVVMIVIAGIALWLGGWAWTAFVTLVALGVLLEWSRLFLAFTPSFSGRLLWSVVGALYVGAAWWTLLVLRIQGPDEALFPLILVIATDVGAYFTGRTLGGAKIAPAISPSKTWSGLFGGMIAAGVVAVLPAVLFGNGSSRPFFELVLPLFAFGLFAAVLAQTGDFFESWMKRRAGVKDSGSLIPGHGGLFDRIDGLLPVLLLNGIILAAAYVMGKP